MRLNGKRLIFWQIYLMMFIRTLTYFIPILSVINYIPDVINIILVFFLLSELTTKSLARDQRFIIGFTMCMLIFDTIRFFVDGEDLILFLWGIRNQYRFIMVSIAVIFFLDKSDLPKMFSIFYYWFTINMGVITCEFIGGYRRDFLGGTFGLEHNCNGVVNVFLCIMTSYAILGSFYKVIGRKKMLFILAGSIYWSALAELKIYFVELSLIFMIALLIVKGKLPQKIRLCFLVTVILLSSIVALTIVYPDQINYMIEHGASGYLRNVNVGIQGFGRISAIPMTNRIFFQNSVTKMIFGVGTGNAEFMMVGKINILSEFYKSFSAYAYNCYFYAFVYIERGIVGLIWYGILYGRTIVKAYQYRKKVYNDKIWFDVSLCSTSCFLLMWIYDSSLRVYASGFLAFLILNLPYINAKKNSDISEGGVS